MSDYSQMLKGIIDGCILEIIKNQTVYGYELTKKLEDKGFIFVSEGSIYPILLRMEKEKWIESTLRSSEQGPKRKYYHITKSGEVALGEFIEKWSILKSSVDNTFSERGEKE